MNAITRESLWVATSEKTNYPALEQDIKVDVVIVGGGITGISCGYLLKNEGLRVAVVEWKNVAQGATGHTTAKVTTQHRLIYNRLYQTRGLEQAEQYAEANKAALAFINKTILDNNISCDHSTLPAYVYTEREDYVQKLWDEAEVAQRLGLQAEFIDQKPFFLQEPKAAVKFERQAQFHPRKYALKIAEKIPGNGCHVFEHTKVVNIEKGKPYIVKTDRKATITADFVIMATQYPLVHKLSPFVLRLYADRSYITAVRTEMELPRSMFLRAEYPGRSLRHHYQEEQELVLVGGENHKTGQGGNTKDRYENLVEFADQRLKVKEALYRWSTQDYQTADGTPFIGRASTFNKNEYVATGFGKWGMTNGTAAALLIRDMIVKGESPWQDVYNPLRLNVRGSSQRLFLENLNVANQFLTGRLSKYPETAEIKAGESKIIKVDGKRTGAYRDEDGELYLVGNYCTHLGCSLSWNSAEKSWDCPCHGARFTYKGEVIEGPVKAPLKRFVKEQKTKE